MDGVFVSSDSVVEEGAKIYAPAHISGGSHICRGAVIMPFCTITASYVGGGTVVFSSTLNGAHVGENCTVGPYAYLRDGAETGANCRIGDFVEVKASVLGNGVKAAHLAYIGDAFVGNDVNVGCGAVFCNFDGKVKHKTSVGDGAFIGANCNLVAPVRVGAGSFIAAGTTVSSDVEPGDFCIGRVKPYVKKGGAHGRYKTL